MSDNPGGNNAIGKLAYQISLQASEAIVQARTFKDEVTQIKEVVKSVAKEADVSFKEAAASIKSALSSAVVDQTKLNTMTTALKTAVAELNAEAKKATADSKRADKNEYTERTRAALNHFAAVKQATQANAAVEADAAAKARQTTKERLANLQMQANAMKEIDKTAAQSGGGFEILGVKIKSLGDIAKFVFSGIFGVTVLGILQNVVRWLGNAATAGKEFVQGMYQLEVGVRALQRNGVDTTIKNWYTQIDTLREKFGIFTTKELVQGSAAFASLTRDMGGTEEELFALQNAIATLAVVNGRAMDEVQKTVALALASGYTEGLQRLGVSINRVTIAMRAAEMGWKGGYNSLTEKQRFDVTAALILEKTAKFAEDLQEYQKTLPGQLDAATTSMEEQQNVLGENLLPLTVAWTKSLAALFEALQFLMPLMNALAEVLEGDIRFFNRVKPAIEDATTSLTKFIAEKLRLMGLGGLADALLTPPTREQMLGDTAIGDAATDEENSAAKIEEILNERADELTSIMEYEKEQREKIALDLQRDLEEIERRGNDKIIELNIDFQNKIIEINRKAAQEAEDAWARYYLDVQQVNEDYAASVAEKTEENNDRLLELEKDYQEKYKRLQEDFILDLEDALRERDAKAVLRLIRKYKLEKDRLDRSRKDEKDAIIAKHKDELAELDKQRDERLRRLKQELDFRLSMILKERDREIAEAGAKFRQDMEQMFRDMEIARRERQIRFEEQNEDLDKEVESRLAKFAEELAKELSITGATVEEVRKLMESYYGQNGYIERVMQYYVQMLSKYSLQANALLAGGGNGGRSIRNTITPSFGGNNTGDTKSRPKVTPLNTPSLVMPSASPSQLFDKSGLTNGSLFVEVALSSDLETRIVDNTKGQIADLIVRKVR